VRPWSEKAWEKSFAAALSGLPGDSDGGGEASSDSESDSDSQPAALAAPAGRDGIASSATAEEAALGRALAKDKWGRFGGREGKMARIAAAEAAHLQAAAEAPGGASAEQRGVKRRRAAEEAAAAAAAAAEAAAEAAALLAPPRLALGSRDAAAAPARAGAAAPPAPDTWWASIFRLAGAGEGADCQAQAAPPATADGRRFRGTEAEQQALCEALDAAKPAGKRGLGRARGGGAPIEEVWQGQKRTFDGEEAEAEEAEAGEADAPLFPDHAAAAAAAGSPAVAKIKWRKLASAALAAAPGGALSERKLRRATLSAAREALGPAAAGTEGALAAAFDATVLRSSRFARTEKGKLALACK